VPPHSPATRPPRLPLLPAVTERQRIGLAALTALVGAAAIALVIIHLQDGPGPRLGLAVLPCIPAIAFGSRWPLLLLALASVGAAAQMATGTTSLLVSLVLSVAGYTVAGYTVAVSVPRLSIRAVLAAAAILARHCCTPG
jgi:hypothetical protein